MKKNIIDILGNYREEPSGRCWESISQQLPAVPGASSSSGGDAGSSSSFSGLKQTLFQKSSAFWIKAAIVAVSTATVATVSTIAIVRNSENTPLSSENLSPDPVEIVINDSANPMSEQAPIITPEETVAISEENNTVAKKEIFTEKTEKEKEAQSADIQAISTTQPVSSPQSVTPVVPISTSAQVPVIAQSNPTTTPSPAPVNSGTPSQENVVTKPATDPVLQNRNDVEEVVFSAPVIIEIPNIITPNGDGLNDYFVIKGIEHLDKNRLTIKDRQGKVVYSVSSYQNKWGDDVIPGIYYYVFEYTINGVDEYRRGSITVAK